MNKNLDFFVKIMLDIIIKVNQIGLLQELEWNILFNKEDNLHLLRRILKLIGHKKM